MLTTIESFPAPDGATAAVYQRTRDVALRYVHWNATGEDVRGTVCVFHGRAEFIEKYFEVVSDLLSRGFAVIAMDWRGQGLSTRQVRRGMKGHIDDFQDYEDDLDAFMHDVVLPDFPPPYFGLAHSMGGHILLRYARRGANPFDRMVLASPMIDIAFRRMSTPFVNGVAEALSLVGLGGMAATRSVRTLKFEDNALTGDERRFQRMLDLEAANPALGVSAPTFGWVHAATESIAMMRDPVFAAAVSVPLIIVIGSRDRVVSVSAAEAMGRRLKAGRTIVIPDGRHELLMERDLVRERFFAAFDAFIPGTGTGEARQIAIG